MSQIIFTSSGSSPLPPTVVETLTADTGGPVGPTAHNINVFGGENINTVGNPGTSTITVNLNESIHLPNSIASGTEGVIFLGSTGGVGGLPFIHNLGTDSTFIGINSGNFSSGSLTVTSVGVGHQSLLSILSGTAGNTAIGDDAMNACTTGSENTALGASSLTELISGSNNISIGFDSGSAYNTNESSNITIASLGTPGDNNKIRIGLQGTGAGQQNNCFIAGIFGVTVGVSGVPVVVDNAGQLGTVVSSKRFKKDIQAMHDQDSEGLMRLRPVSFSMKEDFTNTKRFGLIAEEVEDHIPYLVSYDEDKQPFTVKYNELPIFLLNEIQKQNSIINSLVRRINLLEQTNGSYDEL